MKKLLALILCLAVVFSLAACAGETGTTEKPSDTSTTPETNQDISVALILPGVITDESWCWTAYQGLQQLEGEGYKTQYVENVDTSNCESIAMNFVDDGYTLVIAHGSQFGDAMIRVAEANPDHYFFVYGKAPVDDYPENIGFVDTAVYHATYICGYLAAKMSESGTIGYIGGLGIRRSAYHEECLCRGRQSGEPRRECAYHHDRQHRGHRARQGICAEHD